MKCKICGSKILPSCCDKCSEQQLNGAVKFERKRISESINGFIQDLRNSKSMEGIDKGEINAQIDILNILNLNIVKEKLKNEK